MYGKLVNGKLILFNGGKQLKLDTGGTIYSSSEISVELLIDNGYKTIVYFVKPVYNEEEEKLVENYTEYNTKIEVEYIKVPLIDEEHNAIVLRKITEEENKLTPRRQREFNLKLEGAEAFVRQIENNIILLREKIRG